LDVEGQPYFVRTPGSSTETLVVWLELRDSTVVSIRPLVDNGTAERHFTDRVRQGAHRYGVALGLKQMIGDKLDYCRQPWGGSP
jgi:hypothetical protein